jgi:hypothetical protein
MGTIGNFFRALAEALGLMNRRHDAKNQADVKQAAKAQNTVNTRERIEDEVARKDTDAARRNWAE